MRSLFIYLIFFTTFSSGFGQGAIFDTESYLERELLKQQEDICPQSNYVDYAPQGIANQCFLCRSCFWECHGYRIDVS